jgi:hypothetical protein
MNQWEPIIERRSHEIFAVEELYEKSGEHKIGFLAGDLPASIAKWWIQHRTSL